MATPSPPPTGTAARSSGNASAPNDFSWARESADALTAMLLGLVDELHAAGVGVSLGEAIDAARALEAIDIAERPVLRSALRATLVKRPEDVRVFEDLFEQCFPVTRARADLGARSSDPAQRSRGDERPDTVSKSGAYERGVASTGTGTGTVDTAEIGEAIGRDDDNELREAAVQQLREEKFGGYTSRRGLTDRVPSNT